MRPLMDRPAPGPASPAPMQADRPRKPRPYSGPEGPWWTRRPLRP